MQNLEELRLEARFSVASLAREAGIDMKTVKRAIDGAPVQKVKASAIVDALSKKLGRKIQLSDVDVRIYA